MYECDRCGCLFDAGELHMGVCDDCREYEEQQEVQRDLNLKMRKRHMQEQRDGQIVFIF